MEAFLDFQFANPFIPAAFFVAGLLCMFRLQWQAFFYLLAVIYAVETFNQFSFVSLLLVAQIIIARFYVAAAAAAADN